MLSKIPLLITIDLEEFDIPLEYGQNIEIQEQFNVSLRGMENLSKILDKHNVTSTLFTTANWALNHTDFMQSLAQRHEIASHAYYHSQFEESDYEKSKKVLENISGQTIRGFRMPRLRPVNFTGLAEAGYLYDASMNPTFLPGRYNHLNEPLTPYHNGKVHIIPSSVSPFIRIPLFWLTFKNFPNILNKLLFSRIIKNKVFVFYIHPWEFADISNYNLPFYINKPSGEKLADKLDNFFDYIQKFGDFYSCTSYLIRPENF